MSSQDKLPKMVSYEGAKYEKAEMLRRAEAFYCHMRRRRSLRHFSSRSFSRKVLDYCIQSASCAPSGAHKQPWSFCVVSDPSIKRKIRVAAEKEEYINYRDRMSESWLRDLRPLGTDWHKPFLESAPYLVVVFKRIYETTEETSEKKQNYYVQESVGLACGFFLAAVHEVGLVALTHTPSPMQFLCHILQRPENERPFLLIPVGFPAEGAEIPQLQRKELQEIAYFYATKKPPQLKRSKK